MTVLNGICGLIISHFDKPVWNRRLLLTGMALTIAGAAVFMLTRQPYAGIFCLAMLVVKGRHDPCVAIRAVPVVEAAVAIALADLYLQG